MDCVASRLSDLELYNRCRKYGMNAKVWSRRFAGLLPEVAKRSLHRRKGFTSIQEFAAKVGGMSEYSVERVLQLHLRIKDKPFLLKIFESGTEGWSKIDRVSYIATTETDQFWADQLTKLSKGALELYVQNYRLKSAPGRTFGIIQNQQFEPPIRFSFPINRNVEFGLRLVKQTLEKQTKQSLSWNEAFEMIIKKSEIETVSLCQKCSKKNGTIKICEECNKKIHNV